MTTMKHKHLRQLPKQKTYEPFYCKECGAEVLWAVSKKGKTYLAQVAVWTVDPDSASDGTSHSKKWYPAHFDKCVPTPEHTERWARWEAEAAAELTAAQAEGRIVYGQKVRVFKGRKFPIGTEGTVFWVASEPDAYDTIKVGFKTEAGEKIFINIANLEVVV